MNIVDQAILDWANNILEEKRLPRNATALEFEGYVSCYSSWTCDYGVMATIITEDGKNVTTNYTWLDVLEGLPECVEAREKMEADHVRIHGWDRHND